MPVCTIADSSERTRSPINRVTNAVPDAGQVVGQVLCTDGGRGVLPSLCTLDEIVQLRVRDCVDVSLAEILRQWDRLRRVAKTRNQQRRRESIRRSEDGDIICLRVNRVDVQPRPSRESDLSFDNRSRCCGHWADVRHSLVKSIDESDPVEPTLLTQCCDRSARRR